MPVPQINDQETVPELPQTVAPAYAPILEAASHGLTVTSFQTVMVSSAGSVMGLGRDESRKRVTLASNTGFVVSKRLLSASELSGVGKVSGDYFYASISIRYVIEGSDEVWLGGISGTPTPVSMIVERYASL